MGFQAARQLAAAKPQSADVDLDNASLSNSEKYPAVANVNAPASVHEKFDLEDAQDGIFQQYIEKNGSKVLVSWTKKEETRGCSQG